MVQQKDLLEILGISYREDSFTNIIEYLFSNNNEFKQRFSEKFLNVKKDQDLNDLMLISRSAYIPKINKRIIPDMILYSKNLNKIAIIEVKVLSRQGLNQLKRYEDGINSIIKGLALDKSVEKKYYYLSINNDSQEDENWNYISWSDLYDLFNIKSSREDINYIIDGILSRINSINKELSFEEVKDCSFNNYLKWNLWKLPADSIKEIITSNDLYCEKLNDFNIEYSTNFAAAENITQTNIFILKDEWLSELTYMKEESDISNCYDFHIEIRMSVSDEKSDVTIRLDHHLNPYASNKEMQKNSKYEEFYNSKKNFIYDMKFNKHKELGKDRNYRYNQATGHYLSILRKDEEIKNDKTVEEVLEFLMEEIKCLSGKIEIFKDELINFNQNSSLL